MTMLASFLCNLAGRIENNSAAMIVVIDRIGSLIIKEASDWIALFNKPSALVAFPSITKRRAR